MNIYLKMLGMVQNDLEWVCIDSKKTAVIGCMNPDFWRHSARFWYIMSIFGNNLNAVKNFQNVPNLAGCLFPFIKIDSRSFWTISSIFKKMFIFVHFVHSEHQEPGRGSMLAIGHSFCLYLSD